MDCEQALRILLDPEHHERRAALDQVRNDPDCLARIDQLARAIVSSIAYELSCAEARVQLADYYRHETTQEDAAQAFPDLHAHLTRCPYCQQEYRALQETMAASATGALPPVERTPAFDLSFIDKPLPPMRPASAIWVNVGQIRRLFRPIEVTIEQGVALLGALTAQLQPSQVALAPHLRSGSDDIRVTSFVLPDEEHAFHFQVETRPSANGTAVLILHVIQTETDRPIPDVRMTLLTADGNLVADSLTDEHGAIEFPRLAANRYVVQAQFNDETWEIPVTVMQG